MELFGEQPRGVTEQWDVPEGCGAAARQASACTVSHGQKSSVPHSRLSRLHAQAEPRGMVMQCISLGQALGIPWPYQT